MKTSIVSTIVLALVASAELAEGCAVYGRCRCQATDGSPVNNATVQACGKLRENTRGAEGGTAFLTTTDMTNTTWCNWGRDGNNWSSVNNCSMRVLCTMFGASGADSWCEDKN
ncbi:hypothetical protein LZ30DRAFT_818914 [Colletotrichum cereale]|nr:hypothetical protein LZ30DRAFT_818914 [Colletotrichum cereale]